MKADKTYKPLPETLDMLTKKPLLQHTVKELDEILKSYEKLVKAEAK
jgi:hypothetical protein